MSNNLEPDHKLEFYAKIKIMGMDDLRAYERAAFSSNRFISTLGIFSILGALVFPSTAALVVAGIVVYLLGNTSVGISCTLNVVREQIAKLENT